jgi:hypothetical protein
MYTSIRNIHLAVALFAAVFLLIYGASALQMAYPVYDPHATTWTSDVTVPASVGDQPRDLARWLMDRHDVRGDLTAVATDRPGSIHLTISRPATTHEIAYDVRRRTARIETSQADVVGFLNRLHHIRGVDHEFWAVTAWGWLLFVCSVGLLVLAITGILLWFQRHRERRQGLLVLGVGLVWGLGLMVLIRLA